MAEPVDPTTADLIDRLDAWVREHDAELLDELFGWISQPTVSATGEGMDTAPQYGAELLRRCGFTPEIVPTAGWPVLLGHSDAGPADGPHVLLYGHYDVQPPGPLDEWLSPPFQPEIRDDRVYGRGTGDNKGQHLAQLLGLRALRELTGGLPCRVTVLLDGEEEITSPHLADVVADRFGDNPPDLVVWSDGPVHESGRAMVSLGVRGAVTFELRAEGAVAPLHSGNWGGVAPNPAWELVHALASLRDPDGTIRVPGFDDGVVPLSAGEQAALDALPIDVPEALAGIGVSRLEPPRELAARGFYERLTAPTLTINSLTCLDAGEHRTIIPNVAVARCDVRLVGQQKPEGVLNAIAKHLAEHAPTVRVVPGGSMLASRTLPETPYTEAVIRGTELGLREQPLLVPALGGSLPIAAFTDTLGVPCYGIPLANVDERNHAPNENLALSWFRRGIVAAATVQLALAGN